MGHAFHDSIERSWTLHYREGLRKLGYPQKAIDAVRINPDEPEEGTIPVYLERRAERQNKMGWTISGKFDQAIEGELYDTKSTSVYSYILGSKDGDYIKQGSIYRWLNKEILTGDHIHIQHIFTDWQRSMAKQQPDRYPQSRLVNNTYNLMSLPETEDFIDFRVSEITKYYNADESEIPFCTDEELWRSAPKYKYFANPDKTDGKSTKNFDDLAEAHGYRAEKGKGVVITVPGQVKACGYCPAFNYCKQKDLYVHD